MDEEDQSLGEEKLMYDEEGNEMEEEGGETVRLIEEEEEDADVLLEMNTEENLEKDLEDGEVEEPEQEKKKTSTKTLKVHLPDLLQGIDGADEFPMNEATIEKLDKRAKRFNTPNPINAEEAARVYDSLGIPMEEREKRSTGTYRLEYILMHGIFSLSEDEIFDYFDDYSPDNINDLSEDTCIVRFNTGISSLKAMIEMTKPIGQPRKQERIVKHVLTGSEEPERKVVTRDVQEEYDKYVHPDDIPIDIPEGKWRLGKPHKKCSAILLRFARREDFRPAHYLARDGYKPRSINIEPPVEAVEKEMELKMKNKNFDKKNPWADLCEDWAGAKKSRHYEIPIEELEHPPRRLAAGRRDWDAPEDPDHPVQIQPGVSRKRKILDRLDFAQKNEGEVTTYYSEEEKDEDIDMNWKGKLKRPRMGMVADMEEQKIKKPNIRSRLKGGVEPVKMIKRKIENSRFVVSEEIVEEEEYLSDVESEDDEEILAQEARNKDLRHALTMKIENRFPGRDILKPTKRFTDRFQGGSGKLDDLERDDGEDLADIDNMRIEIRQFSSDEERMDVEEEEEEEIRRELRRRREAREARQSEADLRDSMKGGDLRDRMTNRAHKEDRRDRDDRRPRDEREEKREKEERRERKEKDEMKVVRLKRERVEEPDNKDSELRRKLEKKKQAEKEREEEQKLIEERKREIEQLKEQERKLLERKERKLKEMERRREEERLRARKEKEREREKLEAREKEKERQRDLDRQERERLRAKEKLREKERSRRTRKKSESSEESSSSSESSSSEDSETESSSSESSSEDSSSDSDSDSHSSDSEVEKKRRPASSKTAKKPASRKEPEKKKSTRPESSKTTSKPKESGSSTGKPLPVEAEDHKKASELRDKLKNYLTKAKAAKEEKKDKK